MVRANKKIFLATLVILIFLVGSIGIYGIPKKGETKKEGTGEPSKDTIELDDGYHIPEKSVWDFLKSDSNCIAPAAKNCWQIDKEQRKIVAYNAKGEQADLDDLDFWASKKVGMDEYGNLYDKNGNLYSDNGLVKISSNKIPTDLAGKVTSIGKHSVIPLKDGAGKESFDVGGVKLSKSTYEKTKKVLEQGIDSIDAGKGEIVLKGNKGSVTEKEGITEIILKDEQGNEVEHETIIKHGESEISQTLEQQKKGEYVVDGETVYGEYDTGKKEWIFYSDEKEDKIAFKLRKDNSGNFVKETGFDDEKNPTERIVTASDGTSRLEQRLEGGGVKSQEHYKCGEEGCWRDYESDLKNKEEHYYSRDGTIIGAGYGEGVVERTDLTLPPPPDIYVTADGEWASNELTEGGKDKFQKGEKLTENDLVKPISEDDIEQNKCGETDCKQAKQALADRNEQRFMRGEMDWQEAISDFVGFHRGYTFIGKRLDSWVGGLFFGYSKEWLEAVDKYFAKYIGVDYWESALCKAVFDVEPESGVFIETPDGLFQLVASAQGETTYPEAVRMLCDSEGGCDKGACKEGLCYWDEETTEPIKEYFYKIEYGIRAPSDPKYTPERPAEQAVVFNIKLICDADSSNGECKDVWLYKDEETGRLFSPPENAIKLRNGENYHKTRVKYTPFNYKEICIVWDVPPRGRDGNPVEKNYCKNIEKASLKAFENTEKAGKPGPEEGKEAVYNEDW